MRILILGSGVVGVTSAWYLARAGHEVTVVDRQSAAAMETSYANAGQVSPGYSAPWAAPGVPVKAIKWLMQDLAPLMIKPTLDYNFYQWTSKMVANCTEGKYQINKGRMVRIAEYSRDCLKALREEVEIDYEHRTNGTLQLFRTQKQVDGAAKDIKVLKELGVPFEVLDRDGCAEREPALQYVKDKIVGGLRLPGDETGDCFKFTQALAKKCEEVGVKFLFNTSIDGLLTDKGDIVGVKTSAGVMTADRYLLCLGSYSPLLAKQVDMRLPIYPVKGYSLTLPIVDESRAPVSTVMDETYKVAVTRFQDRIRVGGSAELAGYDLSLPEKRRANVDFVVSDLFGGGGDMAKAEFWTGLRPMTPDGTPVLGGTRYPSLYLNTGHGTLGWTMSLGSAKFVSDLISGRETDIDPTGLGIDRYPYAYAS
ncbi:D-amino acid dehydrogenase [Marinobacterium nitratireducens]|uniref:D-amino acid dehydrogenase n=1 Tax=Marinobacterium nitratireducens TaxID=518897 RepID=A0A917ZPK1_9GAMM|nr:D-amino acid dehydrogenase [Marinobacterium nitratireducens]GGO87304.1 D-amino acid dehydrogenase [Marinobacterium nitratireducens]